MFTAKECKLTITDGDRTYEFPCSNLKITQNNVYGNTYYDTVVDRYLKNKDMKLSGDILPSGSGDTFGKVTDKPAKKSIWKRIGEFVWG